MAISPPIDFWMLGSVFGPDRYFSGTWQPQILYSGIGKLYNTVKTILAIHHAEAHLRFQFQPKNFCVDPYILPLKSWQVGSSPCKQK